MTSKLIRQLTTGNVNKQTHEQLQALYDPPLPCKTCTTGCGWPRTCEHLNSKSISAPYILNFIARLALYFGLDKRVVVCFVAKRTAAGLKEILAMQKNSEAFYNLLHSFSVTPVSTVEHSALIQEDLYKQIIPIAAQEEVNSCRGLYGDVFVLSAALLCCTDFVCRVLVPLLDMKNPKIPVFIIDFDYHRGFCAKQLIWWDFAFQFQLKTICDWTCHIPTIVQSIQFISIEDDEKRQPPSWKMNNKLSLEHLYYQPDTDMDRETMGIEPSLM